LALYNHGVSKAKKQRDRGGGQPLTDAGIIEHIRTLPHGRATYKQLVKELRVGSEDRDVLEAALDRLADRGALVSCGLDTS